VTNWKYDCTPAFIQMSFWHGMTDFVLKDRLDKCNFTYFQFEYEKLSDDCKAAFNDFNTAVDKINIYDVYGKCYPST